MIGVSDGQGTLLRTGRLLPGYVPLDEGVNSPVRGIAWVENGEVSVIAKKVGARVLAVEALCAVYGRAAGLPIPEPLILYDEHIGWMFGSADVGHPNLSQFVNTHNDIVHQRLLEWPGLTSAACFDELIVNTDRHDGNILYDGSVFTLIDHDLCLPYGMKAEAAMPSHNQNVLLDILIAALPEGDLGKRRLLKDADAWISELDGSAEREAEKAIDGVCTQEIQDQLVSFVRARLCKLSDILSEKVNPAQGRLDV